MHARARQLYCAVADKMDGKGGKIDNLTAHNRYTKLCHRHVQRESDATDMLDADKHANVIRGSIVQDETTSDTHYSSPAYDAYNVDDLTSLSCQTAAVLGESDRSVFALHIRSPFVDFYPLLMTRPNTTVDHPPQEHHPRDNLHAGENVRIDNA